MGDSYDQKPDLGIADILGILGFAVIGLFFLYVFGSWIYHFFSR
jgi:hypothetical protein